MTASSRAAVLALGLALAMLAVSTLVAALALSRKAEVAPRQAHAVATQYLQIGDGGRDSAQLLRLMRLVWPH